MDGEIIKGRLKATNRLYDYFFKKPELSLVISLRDLGPEASSCGPL
jgi:hypothetical protein